MLNSFTAAALHYLDLNLSPIPIRPRDKQPLIQSWLPYQERLPTRQEIEEWGELWPDANVAIAVPHGVVVVDLDGPNAERLLQYAGITLPETAPRATTGKGEHVYMKCGGRAVQNKVALFKSGGSQVDIRVHGGYVIAPPSIHPNGISYAWTIPPALGIMPEAPRGLLEAIEVSGRQVIVATANEQNWITDALAGAPEGQRDDTAARLAGYLLSKDIPQRVVQNLLEAYAERCKPPMPLADLQRVVRSIAAKDERQRRTQDLTVKHVSDVLVTVLGELANPTRRSGISSNFMNLNKFIKGGFVPGDLIYLGARPATGKTALALDFARCAGRDGRKTLFVSREMLCEALVRRMLAQEGRHNATELKLGQIPTGDLEQTALKLAGLPVWLTDSARTTEDIRRSCAAMAEPPDFLIVDYLQLIMPARNIVDRRLQVEAVSQELKDIATSFKIPVMCLSSLRRPGHIGNIPPDLTSLRESGELEHDADIIIFLHRPSLMPNELDAIVAKNREGATGTARLRFKPEWVSFFDDLELSDPELSAEDVD